MASIEWIGEKPYIRAQVKGKRYRRRLRGISSRSGAVAWLRRFIKAGDPEKLILLGEDPPPRRDQSDISFLALVVQYFDHHRKLLQPQSLLKKRQRINSHWIPLFGDRLLSSITRRELEEWITSRIEAGISKTTIHNDLKDLKSIINWGIREQLSEIENPVPPLPKISHRDFVILDEDQARKYLEACGPDFYLFAAIALLTGMRRGEILSLLPGDIDRKRMLIRIRSDASHKNSRGRIIPIREDLMDLLDGFQGFDISIRKIQLRHDKARKAIGIPDLRFHDLRHTFASLLIREGYDLSTVSQILGHSSDRLTRRIYVHIYPEHARKVIEGNPIALPGMTKFVTGPNAVQDQKKDPSGKPGSH